MSVSSLPASLPPNCKGETSQHSVESTRHTPRMVPKAAPRAREGSQTHNVEPLLGGLVLRVLLLLLGRLVGVGVVEGLLGTLLGVGHGRGEVRPGRSWWGSEEEGRSDDDDNTFQLAQDALLCSLQPRTLSASNPSKGASESSSFPPPPPRSPGQHARADPLQCALGLPALHLRRPHRLLAVDDEALVLVDCGQGEEREGRTDESESALAPSSARARTAARRGREKGDAPSP